MSNLESYIDKLEKMQNKSIALEIKKNCTPEKYVGYIHNGIITKYIYNPYIHKIC